VGHSAEPVPENAADLLFPRLDLLFEARVPPRQFQKTDVGTLSG